MPAEWVAWLALQQAALCALCVIAYQWPRTWSNRIVWRSAALWFLIQVADELWGGNFWSLDKKQYIFLAVLFLGTWYYIYRNEPDQGKTRSGPDGT